VGYSGTFLEIDSKDIENFEIGNIFPLVFIKSSEAFKFFR